MPLLFPAILAVSFSISRLTSWNSVNLRLGKWWNSAHSGCVATAADVCASGVSSSVGTLMSCRMRGRRVTIPLPRGRKSRPTMFSSTDDLPDDCEPTTTLKEKISSTLNRNMGGPYNLRQIQTIVADSVENKILELVDYPKQVFPKGCHFAEMKEAK